MTGRRIAMMSVVAVGLASTGGSCGGGSGSGGSPARVEIESLDARCAALASQFPPGFDFLVGQGEASEGRIVVADFAPPTLVPFDVRDESPSLDASRPVLPLPPDSDGDGIDEDTRELPIGPVPDGIRVVDERLALLTASEYEEVVFYAPDTGMLKTFAVSVPDTFSVRDNLFLPAPGTSELRTGLSTFACVRVGPNALDSRGDRVADVFPSFAWCDRSTPSFDATFTSGAAVVGDHLFVTMSNVGADPGTENTQYLPGAVLVYDIDRDAQPPRLSPNADRPVILTSAFNPSDVSGYTVGDRSFALISSAGAIGIEEDDPSTPAIEAGGLALSEAAIDVIDAESLELVASIPLGLAGLSSERLAIDPSGRVAFIGSTVDRNLYAVDLAPLASLPDRSDPPILLDGSDGENAVIFDADDPLVVTAIEGGAPPRTCPGRVVGAAFNHAGSRVYATESCDGTLAAVGVDLSASAPVPVPVDRFDLLAVRPLVEPLRVDTLGLPRAPGTLAVRPGRPGRDFSGPDLFFLVGQPEGLLCGVRVESL